MGYFSAPRKHDPFAFALGKVYEAVKIGSTAYLIAEGRISVPVVTIAPTANWIVCGFAVITVALALRGFSRSRATTLAAPCLWAALSAGCLAAGALFEPRFDGIWLSALRFSTAAITLCPMMAVLGAKRPQDRGWQWVVFTLWIVLVWPAAQATLLPSGVHLELFVAWKLFLWGLIGIGLLNYLPTRHWDSALLVALGQILLLREHLWVGHLFSRETEATMGLACMLLAAMRATWSRRANATPNESLPTSRASLDNAWKCFRNSYGAFWSLRILGRVNQAAELREWPLRLTWSGFVASADELPSAAQLAELQQTLATLLRRFVAPARF